jgi:TetR/AcrR family transcriptional regulator, repressor for uid operon
MVCSGVRICFRISAGRTDGVTGPWMDRAGTMRIQQKPLLDRAFEQRHGRAQPKDDIGVRVLDAAWEQFREHGIRRSSVEDVARRAGVSRITVYRRFTNKDVLVEELLLRELRGYFHQFHAATRSASTSADRLVEGFVICLRAIRHDPLIGGLLAVEPDSLIPFLTTADDGRVLTAIRVFIAGRLRGEQESGALPSGVDVDVVAELVARLTLSFLVTPTSAVDLDDIGQIRDLARRYLVPMLADPPAN